MTFSLSTGFPHAGSGTTDAITVAAVGDAVLVGVWNFPNTDTDTAISDTNSRITWDATPVLFNDTVNGLWLMLWKGVATSAGTTTVTVTQSGVPSFSSISAISFTPSAAATWTITSSGHTTGPSGTAITFPSLTPTDSNSLYVGFGTVGSGTMSGTAGTPSGFLYPLIGTEVGYPYNLAPANGVAQVPVMTISASSDWSTVGLILSAGSAAPSGSGNFFPFFARSTGPNPVAAPGPVTPPVIS